MDRCVIRSAGQRKVIGNIGNRRSLSARPLLSLEWHHPQVTDGPRAHLSFYKGGSGSRDRTRSDTTAYGREKGAENAPLRPGEVLASYSSTSSPAVALVQFFFFFFFPRACEDRAHSTIGGTVHRPYSPVLSDSRRPIGRRSTSIGCSARETVRESCAHAPAAKRGHFKASESRTCLDARLSLAAGCARRKETPDERNGTEERAGYRMRA